MVELQHNRPRLFAAFIRHGDYEQLEHTPSAHQPFPLTVKGHQQAITAAHEIHAFLTEWKCALAPVIDASQLLRAWQTAMGINSELKSLFVAHPEAGIDHADCDVQVESFDALAERSVGSLANLTIPQIEAIIEADPRYPALPQDWKSNSHFRLPLQGAESLMEAGLRVATHIQSRMEVLTESAVKNTLKVFVGHGASIRHAAHHLGILAFDEIARLSMFHGKPVIVEFELDTRQWQQVAGNWKVRGQKTVYTD